MVMLDDLRRYFGGKSTILLSESQVVDVVEQIEKQRLKRGFLTNRKHRSHTKEILGKPNRPNCQKRMVLRMARRSSNAGRAFWGCPRCPRCAGTLPLELGAKPLPDPWAKPGGANAQGLTFERARKLACRVSLKYPR